MAKVDVRFKPDRIVSTLRKAVRDTRLLREIAQFIRTRVYQYTKRGQSLVQESRLQPLSTGYVEYRKRLARGEKTKTTKRLKKIGLKKIAKALEMRKFGEFFSPSRSNLTLTGQMLDALKTDVDPGGGRAIVFVDDTPRKDDDLTNAEVAVKVAKAGRPFLGLDRVGRDRIRRMVIADLRRKLKRR